jgi:hypothetical protein
MFVLGIIWRCLPSSFTAPINRAIEPLWGTRAGYMIAFGLALFVIAWWLRFLPPLTSDNVARPALVSADVDDAAAGNNKA